MLLRSKMDLKNDNYPLNLKKGKLSSKPEKKLYNNYNTTNDKNELIEDNTDIFSYVIQNNTNQNYNKSNNVLLETDNLGLTEAENNLYDEENKNPEQNEKLKDRIKNKFDKILNNPESNKNENKTENKKSKNDNNNEIQQTDNKSEVEYSINSNIIFKKNDKNINKENNKNNNDNFSYLLQQKTDDILYSESNNEIKSKENLNNENINKSIEELKKNRKRK